MSCGCAVVGSKVCLFQKLLQMESMVYLSQWIMSMSLYANLFLLDHPSMRQSFASAARQRSFDFDQSKTLPALADLVLNTNK